MEVTKSKLSKSDIDELITSLKNYTPIRRVVRIRINHETMRWLATDDVSAHDPSFVYNYIYATPIIYDESIPFMRFDCEYNDGTVVRCP